MKVKVIKQRSSSSYRTARAKQELYRQAHERLERAIKRGSHIEAVVLIESLMSDRLESALTQIKGKPVNVSTLGMLLREFQKHVEIDDEFRAAMWAWNKSRGLVVHEMVKLTNEIESSWEERIAYARTTARAGKELLRQLRKYTDKITRRK